jgi:hypothetical protein
MAKVESQNSPEMRTVIDRLSGNRPRRPFTAVFPEASPAAVDLLDQILVLDPDRRFFFFGFF